MELSNVNYPLSATVSRRLNVYKLLLTVLVVYIHANASGANFASGAVTVSEPAWLGNFRFFLSDGVARAAVPGFFLTSAVLLYRKPFRWKENLAKKLRTLGIPYLILNTLWIAVFFAAQQIPFARDFFSNPDKIIGSWGPMDWLNAYLGFSGSRYPFLYPLWFVRDLLVLNLLSPVLGRIIDRFPNLCLGLALAAWLLLGGTGIFCLDLQGICFWVLGGVLVKKGVGLEQADRIPLLPLGAAYTAMLLWPILLGGSRFLTRLMILTGVVFWFRVTALIRSPRQMDMLGKLTTFSFGVYLFHEFLLTFTRKAAVKLLPLTPVSQLLQYLLIPAAVIALCIAVCVVLRKSFPRLYGLLTGGRG